MSTAPRYLKCDLIDDHGGGKNLVLGQLIGLVIRPGDVPIVVCCFTEGADKRGAASLNEVVDDRSLWAIERGVAGAHLTKRSVLVLSPEQIRTLHAEGEICYGPTTVVRLIVEPETKTPETAS